MNTKDINSIIPKWFTTIQEACLNEHKKANIKNQRIKPHKEALSQDDK